MNIFLRIISAIMAVISIITSFGESLFKRMNVMDIAISTSENGKTISNIASNINLWDMGTTFYNPNPTEENNVFEFVKYVQLMQCTGGTAQRDLFKDPYDTSTYTDYDFDRLIKNCRGILKLGAKPHLKLGGVPLKFTSGYEMGDFEMNVYPPDDYNLYYDYIKAIALALVDEFGLEEVRSWHFGCMTEYENSSWFMAKSKTPSDSAEAFCKLYDFTVQALVDVLGENVFVGAHSMTVTEGLWDEALFIKHVAQEKNYANGKTGTRISFLSASYYDVKPGEFTSGMPLPDCIEYLRTTAEKYGLHDLIYGVDEGRILCGNEAGKESDQLLSRTVGYTWQAAYDARLFKMGIDCGMDYFSSWGYLSGGALTGYPSISYHVAKNLSEFAGSAAADVKIRAFKRYCNVEIDCLAAWNDEASTMHIMAYNFKNDLDYDKSAELNFTVMLPQLDGKTVTITKKLVSDDCNFFDEWQQDRKTYNIDNDCFFWSPDDPCIDSTSTLSDAKAIELYRSNLRDKYVKASKLVPTSQTAVATQGKLEFQGNLGASNVVFYDITLAD